MLDNQDTEAVAWGNRALAMALDLGLSDLEVHARNNVGSALLQLNDPRGWDELEKSLSLGLAAGMDEHVCRAYTNLSFSAVVARDYARADRYFPAGLAFSEARDLDSWTDYMRGIRSVMLMDRGRWADAADLADLVMRSSTVPIQRVAPVVVLGLIRNRRGDPGGAELLAQAAEIAEATGLIMRIGPVRAALAEAAWLSDDADKMRTIANAGLELSLHRQDFEQASRFAFWLRQAGEAARVDPAPPLHAQLQDGVAPAAADGFLSLGCPYDAALALQTGGVDDKLAALTLLDDLGATRVAAKLRRDLREAGLRSIPRGVRASTRANPQGLTSREVQVLGLVASGLSNREIADRMAISIRTVDHHVSALLAKPGLESRQEATRAAERLGVARQNGQAAQAK